MLHHPSDYDPINVHSCFGAQPQLNLNPYGLMSSLHSEEQRASVAFQTFWRDARNHFLSSCTHHPRPFQQTAPLYETTGGEKDGLFSTNKINIWHLGI